MRKGSKCEQPIGILRPPPHPPRGVVYGTRALPITPRAETADANEAECWPDPSSKTIVLL
jgi:hypothetical protein